MFRFHFAVFLGAIALWGGLARGSIIIDHPPQNTGGLASDTSFVNDGGLSTWQQVGDDFVLTQAASARHLVWYGFYGGDFSAPQFPPQNETFRVRFYDSRLSDGLPGQILFEENFVNPSRIATGRIISGPGAQPEQRFEIDFSQPFELLAATKYWLEIVQLGDLNSLCRWEISPGNQTQVAFINPNVSDWSTINGSLAFQLSTIPEPTTVSLFLIGAAGLALTRPKARE